MGIAAKIPQNYLMTPKELTEFLRRHKMTKHGLARLLVVTEPAVDHWLRGRREIPATVVRLLQFFDRNPTAIQAF